MKIGDTFTEDGLIYAVTGFDGENFESKLVGMEKDQFTEDIVKAEGREEEITVEPVKDDYESMQYSELKKVCAKKGISAKGSKQELIDRLRG